MKFTITGYGPHKATIDVDLLEKTYGDETWETLSSAIMVSVASWAAAWSLKVDDVDPGVLCVDDNEIDISTVGDWKVEIAQLFRYFEDSVSSYEQPIYLAYLSGYTWQYADFDNVVDWLDEYMREYPDDLDDYGRERMSDTKDGLPQRLERYFDFVKYAEDELDGYDEYEWNGTKYLFSS